MGVLASRVCGAHLTRSLVPSSKSVDFQSMHLQRQPQHFLWKYNLINVAISCNYEPFSFFNKIIPRGILLKNSG